MKDYKKEAIIFKAFCDENRLQILDMIKNGEICACKLLEELKIVQSTLSHHMKILCDAEAVIARKEGKWTYYRINQEGFNNAKNILNHYSSKIKTLCD